MPTTNQRLLGACDESPNPSRFPAHVHARTYQGTVAALSTTTS
jgi:hypothetical protein